MRAAINRNTLGAAIVTLAVGTFCLSRVATTHEPRLGSARLVSLEDLPDFGDSCVRPVSAHAQQETSLFADFEAEPVHAADTLDVTRPPVRTIKETYPVYSSVAVDPVRNEVILQDTNLFGVRVFGRTDNTPPNAESTTPKRIITGDATHCEYNNGLSVDLKTGEIYSVAMDTEDNVIVFAGGASGNVAPKRILNTPHRNFASGIDDEKGEIYVTIQHPPKVVIYKKDASGDDKPVRIIEGPHTTPEQIRFIRLRSEVSGGMAW